MAFFMATSNLANAQIEIIDSEQGSGTAVGKGAAQKYFKARQGTQNSSDSEAQVSRAPANSGDRYLALHLGTYLSQTNYKWGNFNKDDIGKFNGGLTYKVGEWQNSMDLMFRADFSSWELNEGRAVKMSLLPLVTFPDIASGFPLYFGAGAGLGVFFKQIKNESSLSFDYQLVAGARFLDVVDSLGFFVEAGLKNHILLLSDGQYNGVFLALGLAFTF